MKVGIIGLGRMGMAIARRLHDAGHEVIGYDTNRDLAQQAQEIGIRLVETVSAVAQNVSIIWLMVPPGAIVDEVLSNILPYIKKGTIIIDGGNSNWQDSVRRAAVVQKQGAYFLDCGTSGGIHGYTAGFCLMVGGDKQAYNQVLPLLQVIAMPGGLGLVGPSGAGHYVKMVHNGIEYALLQAYAEGFHLLKEGSFKEQELDLAQITDIWDHGSVIRSWLLELAHEVFKEDQKLSTISGEIQEGGTGKWTVEDAQKNKIPVPLIEESLKIRAWSRQIGGNYATKVIAMLRNKFGGHAVKKITS